MDVGKNLCISALDQAWEESIDFYDSLTPVQRSALVDVMRAGPDALRQLNEVDLEWVIQWAMLGFTETGLRWRAQLDESSAEGGAA